MHAWRKARFGAGMPTQRCPRPISSSPSLKVSSRAFAPTARLCKHRTARSGRCQAAGRSSPPPPVDHSKDGGKGGRETPQDESMRSLQVLSSRQFLRRGRRKNGKFA
eukprot:6212998-Pleurochrysis_carterae.AAC.3